MLAASVLVAGAARASDERRVLTVFAAASLKTALDKILETWTGSSVDGPAGTGTSGVAVRASYAGSGTLAQQIRQGAPADIFVSANPEWMDLLARERLVDPQSQRVIAGNRLVLIAHGRAAEPVSIGAGFPLARLVGDGRLAMGLVTSVPAGMYGKAALDSLGVWSDVAGRVVQADNVRAALMFVARGEANYGIVYESDVAASDAVSVVATFPPDTHPAIVYPAAIVSGSRRALEARALLDHLASPGATAVLRAHGFQPVEGAR